MADSNTTEKKRKRKPLTPEQRELHKEAMKRYTGEGAEDSTNATVESVRVRVPKKWKKRIQAYAEESTKYNSVNDMICQLLKQEIPGLDDENE